MTRLAPTVVILVTLAVVAAAGDDEPWGTEYTTRENMKQVGTFLLSCSNQGRGCDQAFDTMVAIGPALWARLKKADAALGEKGTPSTNSAPGRQDFEQRMFSGGDLGLLLNSPTFREVVSRFSLDGLRAASGMERRVYYYTVPFEIRKEPLTVAVAYHDVLLVVLSDGRVFWLEMVSDWKLGGA